MMKRELISIAKKNEMVSSNNQMRERTTHERDDSCWEKHARAKSEMMWWENCEKCLLSIDRVGEDVFVYWPDWFDTSSIRVMRQWVEKCIEIVNLKKRRVWALTSRDISVKEWVYIEEKDNEKYSECREEKWMSVESKPESHLGMTLDFTTFTSSSVLFLESSTSSSVYG